MDAVVNKTGILKSAGTIMQENLGVIANPRKIFLYNQLYAAK